MKKSQLFNIDKWIIKAKEAKKIKAKNIFVKKIIPNITSFKYFLMEENLTTKIE